MRGRAAHALARRLTSRRPQQLRALARLLDQEESIAVDLEHHSHRSFLGFTCLMQVSTGRADYLIDTLVLRQHMSMLNSSFMNPTIRKVTNTQIFFSLGENELVQIFHGADYDIQWMQRDFGLYVVNLFDTGQAARVLGNARACPVNSPRWQKVVPAPVWHTLWNTTAILRPTNGIKWLIGVCVRCQTS